MKKKSDSAYIFVNILCLVLLIVDIEFRDYFTHLTLSYHEYIYPLIMTNVAGPLIICLLIVFRQSHHQKASFTTNIIVDSCSAISYLVFDFFLFRFRLTPAPLPETFVILCLFIGPAIYTVYEKIRGNSTSNNNFK
jgi:hypothetical protein